MADVRQLLRAERVSRRLTHPHASYTKDGKLLCNLCETPIKSETQWQSHLHSTQHLLRSQRAKEAEDVRSTRAKKRKAESPTLDTDLEERKRARADEEHSNTERDKEDDAKSAKAVKIDHSIREQPSEPKDIPPIARAQAQADIDEAELAAFEQELADIEKETTHAQGRITASSALNAEATISAAPMTAEELAALASEEQSSQRGRRDAELEAEKEDAARVLEDEFEEMQELEERVRKLRERREILRSAKDTGDAIGEALDDSGGLHVDEGITVDQEVNVIDNDEDEGEDYDEWAFGGS